MPAPLVLYRKWRPTRFADVVGQEHVTQTLRRAVTTGRVAHAYLFTGPRGVGKTSTARILAKALNAGLGEDGEPVADSDVSRAIDNGSYLDLIEIDAASNRGINDIRAIRDGVQFQPVAGKWKIYIIDEVHMLTEPAFNALLKTLEEPPPHVVMILATTDAHKIPATIISRCQRFDFRRLGNDTVIDRLADICGEEDIDCDPDVLSLIARIAWGSLRDAENLLEQLAVSHSGQDGSEITIENARALLGLGDTASSVDLATALLAADAAAALTVINREAGRGADLKSLKNGTVDALRTALLSKAGVDDATGQPAEVRESMSVAARSVSVEKLLHVLSVVGQADVKGDSSPLELEIAAMRAISGPTAPAAQPAAPTGAPTGAARAHAAPASRRQPQPDAGQPPAPGPAATADQPTPARRPDISPAQAKWKKVVWELRRTKFRRWVLGPILSNVDPPVPGDGTITLRFKSRSMRDRFTEEMEDQRARDAVRAAIDTQYGESLTLKIASPSDEQPASANGNGGAMDSPLVRAAMAMGARVVDEEDISSEPASDG